MTARGVLTRAPGNGEPQAPVADSVTARAIQGSLQAPLNSDQKRRLMAAARKAYDAVGRAGGQEFTEWRREQQLQACGVESLTQARQHHFKLLQGHWDQLNGRPVEAFRMFVGQGNGSQDRELALAKLRHTCRAAAADPRQVFADEAAAVGYAAGFLRNKRKTTLETACATDLWHAVITLKRKMGWAARQERKAQGSDKTRQDSILEGGAPGGDGRGAFRHRPSTRNPQTTANVFRGTCP